MGGEGPEKAEETPYQREVSKIASEKWNKYQETYVDLENDYMGKVDQMGEQWQENIATGSANKATQSAFSDAQEQLEKQQFQGGINPASGRFQSSTADIQGSKAVSQADNEVSAKEAQTDRHVGGLKSVVSMGQGQSIESQQGMSEAARVSGNKASQDAQAAYRKDANTRGIYGTAAGMTASYGLNRLKPKEDS